VLTPTYVDDAVGGALAAAGGPPRADEGFKVTGGHGVTTAAYFAPLAAAVGRTAPRVPTALARATAAGLEAASRGFGRRPPVTRHAVNYLVHPGTYDIGKAARLLGWRPEVRFAEGMTANLAWAREIGLLGRPGPVVSPPRGR
jgi:nucleoside-diphosphate-sugar epimerase